MPLRIHEIFHSIQGESTYAGQPCVFVRLTGCHLRCHYCDTAYAFTEGNFRSLEDLLSEITAYPCNLIEFTGGEPLLQAEIHPLMTQLCDLGKTVLIETSGACDISVCDPRVIRIIDFKTPGSGEADRNDWKNVDNLRPVDEIKFVICARADYEWACARIIEHNLATKVNSLLFSPVFTQAPDTDQNIKGSSALSPRLLADWLIHDNIKNARLQLQLHKFIWSPTTRGV